MEENKPNDTLNNPTANTENGQAPITGEEKTAETETATGQEGGTVPEEGSAEQYEAEQSEAITRKQGFRADLEAIVEKWQYAPDVKMQLTTKGMKVGIILVDLKNGESMVEEVFPTTEDEKIMRAIIKNATVSKQ